ncbi:Glycine/D-amino acid oxidase [Salinihabitans flavidus]|uniref:Glycine/D-amino acid oxidase n=1 Tax=Salinihabitans flavidus TaxID=569882 RepID=A0A1H8PV04_9RHOB|nr:FAD-binding oxidoreductase [Salinihabitans flavidus]SEO45373.1 Glycine/D-amino acid oxidase [Salinihabitans flavidus]
MTTEDERGLWAVTCAEQGGAPMLTDDREADLVIVGGGFTGCAAALEAARSGARVCLLEARDIGFGGSGRNVGLVNAGLWLPPADIRKIMGDTAGDRLSSILAEAPDQVFGLIEAYGIECEPARGGTLHCAHAPAGRAELERRCAQLAELGAPVTLLDKAETAARTGAACLHGALFDPRAGTIQPLAYARGLARAAQVEGAEIFEHSPASAVRRHGDLWQVESMGGTVRAPALLLASNAYHLPFEGLEPPAAVPVHFFQMATRPLPDDLRRTILPGGEGCWDTATVMSAFRTDAAGRVIVGGIGALDHGASGFHRGWAPRKLAALFPALAGQPLDMAWQGRIAMTSDHVPKITRPGPGALAVHGYSGRGIGPGTAFGIRMARALLDGDESPLPVAPLDHYSERLTGLRAIGYEAGATLAHLTGAR